MCERIAYCVNIDFQCARESICEGACLLEGKHVRLRTTYLWCRCQFPLARRSSRACAFSFGFWRTLGCRKEVRSEREPSIFDLPPPPAKHILIALALTHSGFRSTLPGAFPSPRVWPDCSPARSLPSRRDRPSVSRSPYSSLLTFSPPPALGAPSLLPPPSLTFPLLSDVSQCASVRTSPPSFLFASSFFLTEGGRCREYYARATSPIVLPVCALRPAVYCLCVLQQCVPRAGVCVLCVSLTECSAVQCERKFLIPSMRSGDVSQEMSALDTSGEGGGLT